MFPRFRLIVSNLGDALVREARLEPVDPRRGQLSAEPPREIRVPPSRGAPCTVQRPDGTRAV